MAYISVEERMSAARKGLAMPDGQYPIRNQKDLKDAWLLRNNSKKYNEAQVIAHIRKVAEKLGLKLPEALRGE